MDSRSLNRIVQIQRLSGALDALSQPIPNDWVQVAEVWANIAYLTGIETVKSDAPVSVAKASIRIIRRTDVVANMRVVYGSTLFDIKAVLPDEIDREKLDLACETGQNQG